MKRYLLSFFLFIVGCTSLAMLSPESVFASPTLSKDPLGLNPGAATGLPDQDVRVGVARVIKFVLGFLGLIFLVLIIYAGFRWMTSGGNEEAIGSAKKTLGAAIIGLVIIMFSYSITVFVLENVYEISTSEPYNAP